MLHHCIFATDRRSVMMMLRSYFVGVKGQWVCYLYIQLRLLGVMVMNKNETVIFRCDYEFKKHLDELVAKSGKTKSEFIRDCIQDSDATALEQKLSQINISSDNRSPFDSSLSNLTNALGKARKVDEVPKELLVMLEDLIKNFRLIGSRKAKK